MKKKTHAQTEEDSKKKKPSPRKGGGKKVKSGKRGKGSSGIASFTISGLVSSALIVGAMAAALGWLQFARHQHLSEQKLANALAQSQAGIVAASLGDVVEQAETLADSSWLERRHPDLSATELSRGLSSMLPNTRVHLVAGDIVLPGTDLSFTARELVQKAREGDEPAPVLLPDDPAIVYVARSTPAGVLVLEHRLTKLPGELARQDLQNGFMALRQAGGEILVSRGTRPAEGVQVEASGPYDTKVTLWLPYAEQDPALLYLFAMIVGGGLLLVLVTQAFVFRTVAQAIRKDAALLVHLAKEMVSNPAARPRGEFSFQPLALVTNSLQKLAEAARQGASRSSGSGAPDPDDVFGEAPAPSPKPSSMVVEESRPAGKSLPAHIFREYDIRGRAGSELDAEAMRLIGQAVGSEAQDAGQQAVIVARDGRNPSPELCDALIEGLVASGRKVIKLGAVPTPVMYYATGVLDTATGVCVTGSHNPADYNGVKIVLDGVCLHGEGVQRLRQRISDNDLASGEGSVSETDLRDRYSGDVEGDIVLARPMKVVVDCANGIAGELVPELLGKLECEVVPLFSEVDGSFPNHAPDPGQPGNLKALIDKVSEVNADLGIAFDGDGDRLGVVTGSGEIIWPDRLMMLFARDLLSRSPGADILFDVKSSRELSRLISQQGGRPLMCKTGHSLMHARMLETGAPLGGEMSGHIFFADRWNGFDDAIYAAARLLEILSLESEDVDDVFASLKTGVSTPEIIIEVPDDRKFDLVKKLVEGADQIQDGSVSTLDGLRVDFEDGWGLVRASNTQPALTARFEGNDEEALKRVQSFFSERLKSVDPQISIPF